MVSLRVLNDSDESSVEAFLRRHRDTSMFLRANARHSGFTYEPKPFHATYTGAFRDGEIVGVCAHCWNGVVLVQAPECVEDLVCFCVKSSGRRVTGLSGPLPQTRSARIALGLADTPAALDSDEALYGLDLKEIIVPSVLSSGEVTCRFPLPAEREILCAWRLAYEMETLGATDSEQSRQRCAKIAEAQIAEQNAWVAVHRHSPVSLSAFNATLPDIVQLGGIYTPPGLRGRGYAKAAVATSLLVARDRGVTRAVLFTSNPSAARSYEAVGFQCLDDFGLVLFDVEPGSRHRTAEDEAASRNFLNTDQTSD